MSRKEFSFPSSDGKNTIHAVVWEPDEKRFPVPKGIVQISHGMVEYIERYDELALYLNQQGFLVAGNDHLGHGKTAATEEDWGYFTPQNGSRCVVEDLHRLTLLMKKKYPDVPYFLLGHSMGSFMARRYIMTYGGELSGALLLGTGNQPEVVLRGGLCIVRMAKRLYGERYRSKKIQKIMFGAYNKRIKNPQSENDWVTSDPELLAAYNATPACSFQFTLNGFEVLLSTLLYIGQKKHIENIPKELPVILLAGLEDPVGNYGEGVKAVYRTYKNAGIKNIKIKLYENCRHELQNEVNRQEVFDHIAAWLDKTLKA